MEEIKWLQIYKDREINEGDSNTRYYHARVNGRRRKNRITSLEHEGEPIEGDAKLMEHIANYYKTLFGQADNSNINLDIQNPEGISPQEESDLIKPFSVEEIRDVVFNMEKNKSPGPDGFAVDFYQHFWEMLNTDLKAILDDFHSGKVGLARLNYGIITLVLKVKDARHIQRFRPICLLNVSFKIITKVLMNKLSKVVNPIISPIQTAFVKGRYIMEGVVILHEALNSIQNKKQSAMLFKVDFEKAYDKIKWPFVHKLLQLKKFPDKWCD